MSRFHSSSCGLSPVTPFWLIAAAIVAILAFPVTSSAQTSSSSPEASSRETGANEVEPSAPGQGFWNRLGSTLNNAIGGKRDKPQITDLKTGPYKPSNEALGDERDTNEQRVKGFGLVNLPELANYANAVLNKLKAESGVENIPGRVLLVAKPGLEAASTPDGNILVSLDWFNDMTSEDELAALLAHELAHILLRHHDSNIFGKIQKQVQTLFAMGIQLNAAMERATGGGTGTSISPGQSDALRKMELYIRLTDGALHPAWNRRQELEADRLAIDLTQRAKYSYSNGVKSWLEKVRQWDAQQNAKRQTLQTESQRVVQELVSSGKIDQGIQRGLTDTFNSVVEQLGHTHDGGEKRIDEAQTYVESVYPELTKQPANTAAYQKVFQGSVISRTMKAYKQSFEAMALIESLQYASAAKTLEPVVARNAVIAAHAVPNYLMYEALKGLKRDKDAMTYLNRSFEAPDPAWRPFDLAADYYKTADSSKIVPLGQQALTRFKDAPALYPSLVRLYARTGQVEPMKQVLSACVLSHVQYRDDCNRAAQLK